MPFEGGDGYAAAPPAVIPLIVGKVFAKSGLILLQSFKYDGNVIFWVYSEYRS